MVDNDRSTTTRDRGRPREDQELQVYLHVEAGTRATGLSVNAFCKAYRLAGMRLDFQNRPRPELIAPATVRRTYVRMKARFGDPEHPSFLASREARDELERLVSEHMKNFSRKR